MNDDLTIVGSTANALVYKGLREDIALQLILSLTENQRNLLILTLVKMMDKFNGRK